MYNTIMLVYNTQKRNNLIIVGLQKNYYLHAANTSFSALRNC